MADDKQKTKRRDFGFVAIVTLVGCHALWLLLMPVVPAIASATLHRFHLRTRSFSLWAVQQPIPSMYNFANRYEVSEISPYFLSAGFLANDFLAPVIETDNRRYINHFPTRVLTFANRREFYLADGTDRWVTLESTYRGQTLRSKYHAQPRSAGGFDMLRLSEDQQP
jgi:hypothetical protein